MWIKKIQKPVENEQGAALLLVLMMLIALLGSAGWLAMQTRTETAIVAAIKDYSKTFNVADGSWWLSLYYFVNVGGGSEFSAATPKNGGSEIPIQAKYRNFINNSTPQVVVASTDNIETMAKVIFLNYIDRPGSGTGITSKGSETPVQLFYQLDGKAKLNFDLTDGTAVDRSASKMSALVIRDQ